MKLAAVASVMIALSVVAANADEQPGRQPQIGYTTLQTNLPGNRHTNVRTMRAVVANADGTSPKEIGSDLIDGPDVWTQFAGWSPDGRQAVVLRCWQDPANASWEEEHQTFRMKPGTWLVDTCLIEMRTGSTFNVTAVDRVSHYNSGLFFLPDKQGLGFTSLIDGVSTPFIMDVDGQNKRNVVGNNNGFAYGYSASPDGRLISYHENYQVCVSMAEGSDKRTIDTGNPFNFAPCWSPDGEWLLFVSGTHYDCHPHIVRRDGSELRKIADRAGYRGVVEFLDVHDFHGGSSDVPIWSADSQSVIYTAAANGCVELFRVSLTGEVTQLTRTARDSLNYHPTLSPNGRQLLYGSKRGGIRQLFVMNIEQQVEQQVTQMKTGHAAMWPHWQPQPQFAPQD